MNVNNFGNTIRQLREARGITQSQLSDRMSVSRSTIANWETGTRLPDLHMLSRLAECLGVNPTDLMEYLQDSQEVPVVIIVEDMPLILSSSRRMLSQAMPEAEIYGFGSAAEAQEFACSRHISIAFLDIELGSEDGISLGRALTALNSQLNVIFLTSHPEYMKDALADHCSGYILKPLTPEKISHELRHLRFPVRGLKA